MAKIPVYLLNGALGSGKTTLLKELLRTSNQRFFVIENEIANTAVDDIALGDVASRDDIHTIAGECVCCSDGTGLIEALGHAREQAYDAIFIESTGAASMARLLVNLLGEEFFTSGFTLQKAIYVIDALAYRRGQLPNQDIEVADAIVVSKTDLLPPEEARTVQANMRTALQKPLLFKKGPSTARQLLAGGSAAQHNLQHLITVGLREEPHQPATFVLHFTRTVQIEKLTAILAKYPVERAKGFIATPNGTVRFEATKDHSSTTAWPAHTTPSYLVLIDPDKEKVMQAKTALKKEMAHVY